jgi:hypothetical protein
MVQRYLHVANGTSVTMTLEAGGFPGLRSIWADPLYEGPVPAGLNDDELRDVRAGYLGGGATVDPMNDMRRWRDVIADRGSYDELVLWFEHDLFDQLNLIQLLSWIRSHPLPGRMVSLICIGSFPGCATFKGLGELTAAELASLFDTRTPVSDAESYWRNAPGGTFANRLRKRWTISVDPTRARCRSSRLRSNVFFRNIRG